MALLCNINSDPKKGKLAIPADFNPYTQAESKKHKRSNVIEVNDADSRALFKAVVTGQRSITEAVTMRV
ncbi:MAG: hypothetical protein A2Y12_04915 [Planctomycetes bacterium GWF2_42_9]|nr:MAG: hypothetical protein A2Y12_04915 [Planctomycetes bacterium GWF2_42_9]